MSTTNAMTAKPRSFESLNLIGWEGVRNHGNVDVRV